MKKLVAIIILSIVIGTGYWHFFYNQEIITEPLIDTTHNSPSIQTPPKKSNVSVPDLLTEAKKLTQDKEYKKALDKYVEAYNANRSSNLGLIGIASIYYIVDQQTLAAKNLTLAKQKGALTTEGKILQTKIEIVKNDIKSANNSYTNIDNITVESLTVGIILDILNNEANHIDNKIKTIQKLDPNNQLAFDISKTLQLYKTFTDSPVSYLHTLIAQNLIDNDEYILARPLLYSAIQDQNNYKDPWLFLGYSYLLSNKNKDALKALERAKQIDPYNPNILFYLGLALQKNNQPEKAVDMLKQANSYGFRNTTDSTLQLAHSFYLQGNYTQALKFFLDAEQKTKLSIQDYTKIVFILVDQVQLPQQALPLANKIVNYYPATPMAYNLAGWIFLGNKDYSKANTALLKALELDPNFDAAYLNLGLVEIATNNPQAAKEYLNRAVQLSNNNRSTDIGDKAKRYLDLLN